ncbi:riboflavin synthase [Saccharibacter sp. 17.LH.SD]|uniref:riboflavin synthase n=1 Tax=Saccharibacter sp. 17.LH.SD TaxID=2689393 RepID=UPI00136CCA63|nr:riboflavin synthase [Saccharibacter sp. 17.LH.SD]MXV45206.1 riboflavin synthase [Saccharibacter sp. 17.LH.SD]
MFSGIIDRVGHVEVADVREHAMDLRVSGGFDDLVAGESIAVNGVCLTVERFTQDGTMDFHLSGETLSRTALGELTKGSRVNLERAVSLSTRLSGHIVQGHVDTVAFFIKASKIGDSHHVVMFLPQELRRYVVEKGSITLNGISLTVNTLRDGVTYEGRSGFEIGLMIIPHTWTHTDLSTLTSGVHVNVEVDVMAKYVENLLKFSPEDVADRVGDVL